MPPFGENREKEKVQDCSGSGKPFPAQSVDLFHDLADFLFHALAGFTLCGEVHETDLGLTFAEVDFPFVLSPVLCDTDAVPVMAALSIIKTGGNQMIFEKLL